MKFVLNNLVKTGAVFSLLCFTATIVDSILSDESVLTSDNSYCIGAAVGLFLVPAVVLYLCFEKFSKRRFPKYLVYFLCLSGALFYLLNAFFHAELEGPAIAMLIILFLVALAVPVLFLMRVLNKLPVLITLWGMGLIYALGFFYVRLVAMSAQ